jgi:hypothetical protein
MEMIIYNYELNHQILGISEYELLHKFYPKIINPQITSESENNANMWDYCGSSISCLSLFDIKLLKRAYSFYNESEIELHLCENPYLVSLLFKAYSRIMEFFLGSRLILEVISNPEEDNDSQLVLYISTNLKPEIALKKLDEFDEQWWLNNLQCARGKLCIDIELQ